MTEKNVGLDNPELNQEANAIWERISGPWDDEMGPIGESFFTQVSDPVADRLLDLKSGEVALDIACGAGRYARHMAEKGVTTIGVDHAEEFLSRARAMSEKSGIDVKFKHVDATDFDQLIALGEEKFDAINCTMGLMNMASLTPLARAIPRLLKPGGRFVFIVAHPVFGRASARRVVEDDHSTGTQRHSITSWDYLDATPDMGFSHRNQTEKQYFFDRPIEMLLNVFFEHGMVMDRLEEPAFHDEMKGSRSTAWANFKLMPFFMAVRLRRITN
jgi:ubiquinone/menaquinone biosynthesis C-methylase UbiE